ncbi:NADP-dependent oxidoreductase [Longispora sp. K20-0274]|uniref:NADP-dependent oxidoreductase n=1 Tax=Longispora sp. K20-0274 TaxID=3088255 RepID=UPI00399ADC21
MRAMQAPKYGEPITLVDLPVPTPGAGEVLIRVAAAGVNPVDWKAHAGYIPDWFHDGPYVWGWDVSGTVEAVGEGVTAFAPGDEVYGMPRFPDLVGGYAEYVTAPVDAIAAKPAGLDHVAAAALPLAGLTALQALDLAGVTAGTRVLVHAAAGGVGHLAVQLAKARGAHVTGTARAANHDFLRSIGVDEPVDYTEPGWLDRIAVDVVLDGMNDPALVAALQPGGILVTLPAGLSAEMAEAAKQAGVRATAHLVVPDGPGLRRFNALVDAGELRVEVAETLPLEDVTRAHDLVATGRTRGKVVLTI